MENKKSFNADKYVKRLLPAFFFIYVLFLFLYIYVSGLRGDDFYYLTHPLTKLPIASTQEMISATNYYYQHWNGRYIINFLNHFIVNNGMLIQSILVISFYLIAIYAIYKLNKFNCSFYTYFFLVTGLMMITSNEYLFNISCLNISLNYFFIVPFYMLFLTYLINNKSKFKLGELLFVCILAFLCGSFTETYSFSLAIVILIQIFRKKFDLTSHTILIGAFYIMGVMVLLLCPGSGSRTGLITSNSLFIIYWLNGVLNALFKWGLVPFILVYLSYRWCKINFNSLTNREQVLLLYGIVQVISMLFSPYLPERSLILVNLMLISLALKWILKTKSLNFLGLWLGVSLCCQLIISIGIVVVG